MKIRCCMCDKLVGEIAIGSLIRNGTEYLCRDCYKHIFDKHIFDKYIFSDKDNVSDFNGLEYLKSILGMNK